MPGYDSMRYKDDLPANTVQRIKKILDGLGIGTVEKWFEPVNGLCSLQVILQGTGIKTNGKGTTPEYAMASAYAEFIERLQNLALINYPSPEIRDYQGFYAAPDEKRITLEDMYNASDGETKIYLPPPPENEAATVSEFLSQWLESTAETDAQIDALQNYKFYAAEGDPPGFTAVPFYSVSDETVYYVPSQVLRLAYGSNGMCAGNTPEEAIVQGISEVLERHANLQILKKQIVPPTIPEEYIAEHFPQIFDMIKEIERQGNYKLIFKDCSLNRGFPVTALIIADAAKQRYFVKFGAHPALEIALERCLTEMFQCRDINLNHEMPGFRYYKATDHPANVLKILKNGYGYYPASFFSPNFSYQFTGFQDISKLSNREKLRYLTGLLTQNGYRILIRDVSFLGFPSYQILIPGLSEVRGIDVKLIEHVNSGKEMLRIVRDLNHATEQDLKSAVRYLQNASYYQPTDDMALLMALPVSNFHPVKLKKHLLLSLIYCKLEQYKAALEAMDIYLSSNPAAGAKPDSLLYKCARDYLEGLSKGADHQEIQGVLGLFYPSETVESVASFLANPQNIFSGFGAIKCWECGICKYQDDCLYERLKSITMKLKARYANHAVDQYRLKDLFTD